MNHAHRALRARRLVDAAMRGLTPDMCSALTTLYAPHTSTVVALHRRGLAWRVGDAWGRTILGRMVAQRIIRDG